jgi:processing peptidase subunit alpha
MLRQFAARLQPRAAKAQGATRLLSGHSFGALKTQVPRRSLATVAVEGIPKVSFVVFCSY